MGLQRQHHLSMKMVRCCVSGSISTTALPRLTRIVTVSSLFPNQVGFMAYNTLAGGMLTGKYINRPAAIDNEDRSKGKELLANPRGRMDEFGWGRTLYRYRTDAAQEAIVEYSKIAKSAGISLTELSLRWCRQRSLVTTSLVGHSNMKQLKESIDYFTKSDPLNEQIMWEIDVSVVDSRRVYTVVSHARVHCFLTSFLNLSFIQRVHMRNRLPIFSSNRVGKDWLGEGGTFSSPSNIYIFPSV